MRRAGWWRSSHKALKTGCGAERSQLRTAAALTTLVGLLSVVAVRLLPVRGVARTAPDTPALAVVEPDLVRVVARCLGQDPTTLSARQWWWAPARLGGFVGRRGDGEPDWQTLWRGWQHAQDLLTGYRLAQQP